MHLAESREELELLQSGGGPFRTLLEGLAAWDTTAMRPESRPLDYLRHLALANRALVIHGNYLDDEEIAFLGAHRDRMAVVYCPRTHDWFAHNAYPLEKMLASGAMVALGTDGRGSSPDLSLLEEMRFAARRHPAIGLDKILRMGTIDGARALGQEAAVGSIAPGKQADLAIVALPDRATADPCQLLFDSAEPVVACYCRGVEIDDNKRL
jgi:cytosine/adenosine deaminase-related metal-dependent hydrolase